MTYLELQVSFSLNCASLFSVMRGNSSVICKLKLYMSWTKEAHQSAKFQTFNCLRQICTLIGSFCWKYIKFQLKRYRGVPSHDLEEWYKIWRKTDLLFQKWQEFGEFWLEQSDCFLLCKAFNFCPRKLKRSYISWHWRLM